MTWQQVTPSQKTDPNFVSEEIHGNRLFLTTDFGAIVIVPSVPVVCIFTLTRTCDVQFQELSFFGHVNICAHNFLLTRASPLK